MRFLARSRTRITKTAPGLAEGYTSLNPQCDSFSGGSCGSGNGDAVLTVITLVTLVPRSRPHPDNLRWLGSVAFAGFVSLLFLHTLKNERPFRVSCDTGRDSFWINRS